MKTTLELIGALNKGLHWEYFHENVTDTIWLEYLIPYDSQLFVLRTVT